MCVNDFTMKELDEKLEIFAKSNTSFAIHTQHFKKFNIPYVAKKTSEKHADVYIKCRDGLVVIRSMWLSHLSEDDYMKVKGSIPPEKVKEEELGKLALRLNALEKEADAIKKILELDKLRGLFAKMKSTK